jgi:hypothetical protein
MNLRRLMLQLALVAALAPCGRADDAATPVPEWRAALRSEVRFGPAAAPAKDAPVVAAAPTSPAPADPNIVQMAPYTLQESRMNLPSVEAAIETPSPGPKPVKWGTGVHAKEFKHVTLFYYSILYVPIVAGFSW